MFATLKNISINVSRVKSVVWKLKNQDDFYCVKIFLFDSPTKHELVYGIDDEDIENLKKAICPNKSFKEDLKHVNKLKKDLKF